MHRVFLNGAKGELGSYSLDQAFLTKVFTTGTYNCQSSALLYGVLARGFDISARGVVLPTHVFIEVDAEGGKKVFEVETTSDTGFDLVHDERFYKEESQGWSSKRGLKPGTFEEYKRREIVPLHRLIAQAMMDGRLKQEERPRLAELASLVAPEDPVVQHNIAATYVNEAIDLHEKKAWRTLAKMLDTVEPNVARVAGATKDKELLQHFSWLHIYRERALIIVGRAEEAVTIMDADLRSLDPKLPEYEKLRQAHVSTLADHLYELVERKDYDAAIKLITPRFDLCKSDELCRSNLIVIYHNQFVRHMNSGDADAAKNAVKECISLLPNAAQCEEDLQHVGR